MIKCHRAGTEVYVSVGGYSEKNGPPLVTVFEKIGANDHLRETFVNNVLNVVQQYGFDGVELDWGVSIKRKQVLIMKKNRCTAVRKVETLRERIVLPLCPAQEVRMGKMSGKH